VHGLAIRIGLTLVVVVVAGSALLLTRARSPESGPQYVSLAKTVDPASLPGILTGPPPWQANTDALRPRLQAIGLPALSSQGTALHIHQHLDLYVAGKRVTIPADIGIVQTASGVLFSPIHTHDTSGIIHVESPTVRPFTLGEFFDVWGVRFTPDWRVLQQPECGAPHIRERPSRNWGSRRDPSDLPRGDRADLRDTCAASLADPLRLHVPHRLLARIRTRPGRVSTQASAHPGRSRRSPLQRPARSARRPPWAATPRSSTCMRDGASERRSASEGRLRGSRSLVGGLGRLATGTRNRWWEEEDSNLRRLSRRFYRPLPLAARASSRVTEG
jgi:hypothetical protein